MVMAPRPGRIAEILDVPASKPRDRRDPVLAGLRHAILDRLEATQGAQPQAATAREAGRHPATPLPLAARSA